MIYMKTFNGYNKMNALLKSVPKGITVARNPDVWAHYMVHTGISNVIMTTLGLFILSAPLSLFPITFKGGKARDTTCFVDYSSGEQFTMFRHKARFVDYL